MRSERSTDNRSTMAARRAWRPLGLLVVLCAGCGGGGGGSAPTPPTPPPPNQPPVVAKPNGTTLHATELHPFSYDLTQGGKTFVDPDGDPLQYSVTLASVSGDFHGAGTNVVGVPTHVGTAPTVTIEASDGRGGTVSDTVQIVVNANAKPAVARPNRVLLVQPGQHVDYDPTQGGAAFTDADGDRLSYATVAGVTPPGLSVVGGHVVGSLSSVGFATFEITASDGFGGTVVDKFGVAVPAPEPGRPVLPAVSYSYADAEQPFPWEFRFASERFAPFWDTTAPGNGGVPPTNAGATLGRVLFYDKRLSVTNTHSCSSCHEQAHNFATPERFPTGILGVPLKRNAMSLANARYNFEMKYFIDQRVFMLENLVLLPIEEQTELGNPLPMLVEKLARTDFYGRLFTAAFGTPEVTPERIRDALSQFVRSLISFRARYDKAFHPMNVDDQVDPASVFTPEELRGLEIFTGVRTTAPALPFTCATCHSTTVHLMDAPSNNGLDVQSADSGNAGTFRVASLRNVALSGPYMHDGRFATLREVIEHYDHGIQDSPQLSEHLRENRVDAPLRLNMSESDKDAIEAFLNTLTDTVFLNDPRFSDPFP